METPREKLVAPSGEPPLPILYQDEHCVVINKPSGLLVHKSPIDRHETRFAMKILRDQLGQWVYPIHRLDKPTSGALLFGLSADVARQLGESQEQRHWQKRYLTIVRGWAPESGCIDHPLKEKLDKIADKHTNQNKPAQSAVTHYRRLASAELPISVDRFPTTRYSFIRCQPVTGRKHQIRRHMKHIGYPIIGDAKHGKGIHNRGFRDYFLTVETCQNTACESPYRSVEEGRLMLHAHQLTFCHPYTSAEITVTAPLDHYFQTVVEHLFPGAL
ncbi:pseudouridine synthase [Marinibactrum halimedae]|uniref:tRNA pseudouridine synthase C n=1 Tax=Marinibactrum halimedae TaxID=1444977 RepID=A0AA37WP92_9GAMM|nr:pseudouridine synthase [Marinibactrum halimedae]MCD9459519.1 pseudouridine synthase [Marinibactrum halimedae]GLS28173.1 tRNA pseudouridine synthase C [Marinibactrum halimedae]